MFKLILLLIYLIFPLIVIFLERKNATEALLWVLILLCFPFIGIILYLILGSTLSLKLTSYIRRNKITIKKDVPVEITNDKVSDTDAAVIKFNNTYNNSIITCYDKITALTSGKLHYESLFNDIKNAKKYILVEFYTIHHDLIGDKFIEILTEKVKEGVKVIIMFDFLANIEAPNKMFKPFIKEGGKVIKIKPFLTHYRNHRKIVTIDGNISYIGGMNIGIQYADMHKKKTPWRDTQVKLEGHATSILNNFIINDIRIALTDKKWDQLLPIIKKFKPVKYKNTSNLCQFIESGIENDKESIKMCYLSMIRNAKKSIRIQSPYFIPDTSILDALKTALATGIKIELMLPKISSGFFLEPVSNYYCGELLKYGAKIYKYHGYLHAKTMIIDNEICCVGSVNIDNRSFMINDEICGVFYENGFVNEYLNIFKDDLTKCNEYKLVDFKKRTKKEKILECIFLPFSPLM